ncbi:MAG: lysylphosphatidylglycerol synthase transmembrane domain-containing protein [Coriobacteriales bacterium]|nr:lysylphosphatidylglycerol synthase transmembrane domain-containing protein [Coriobacteriales bacterium]
MTKSKKATPKPNVSVKVGGGAPSSEEEAENRAKARKGALFLAFVVVAYVIFLILSGQMGTFIGALSGVDMGWVWAALFCYGMYFVFGVLAYVIAVYLDHDSPVGVRDLMSVEASGVFFGNLTPMMAGSVPAQIVRLTRTGLDAGEASATQFTRFIMFQFGVVLFAAIMLGAKLEFFFQTYGDIVFLNLVVFGVHLLELIALFVICLCPHVVMKAGNFALKIAGKHLKPETVKHWDEVINVQVMEFSQAFRNAAKDLPSMGLTLLVTMAQLACLYMIPWFVLRAFDKQGDFLECLAAGSMVQMVSSAVPLPGGTGGAEGGFMMFYSHMFGSATSAGFIIWRIITFFLPTILAAPLLGLKTTNRSVSIYHRVCALRAKLSGKGRASAPVAAYRPNRHASQASVAQAGTKVATGAKASSGVKAATGEKGAATSEKVAAGSKASTSGAAGSKAAASASAPTDGKSGASSSAKH